MCEIYFIECYKDLMSLIDVHRCILNQYKKELDYCYRIINANFPHDISSVALDGMPHGGRIQMSLDRVVERKQKAEEYIRIENNMLSELNRTKQELDAKINNLQGVYFKVAYMRNVENKTLQQISDELNYSLSYIEKISSNLSRNEVLLK